MRKSSGPDFKQMLAWLMTEVMFGRAHFRITRGLRRADRAVLDTAPRFFDLTLDAHANSAQLAAARIFDPSRGVSIHALISAALDEAGSFKYATADQVRKAVTDAKATIAALKPTVTTLRTRRNETMAHVDPRTIVDPEGYVRAGRMSYREFEALFEKAGAILNRFSLLYRGSSISLDLDSAKDYERALGLIAEALTSRAAQKPQ